MNSESQEKEIHDNLIRFGKMITKASSLIEGVIDSVDEVRFTCDIAVNSSNPDGSTTKTIYNDVPIKVLKGSQASLIEIPAVGSDCLICFRDNNIQRIQLVSCDKCSKVLVKFNTQTLQIDTNGFVFNGGDLKGLVKLSDLITKLNNLENDINNLKTAFTSWLVVPSDGGSALKTISATWAGANLTPTVEADLENVKIKQ